MSSVLLPVLICVTDWFVIPIMMHAKKIGDFIHLLCTYVQKTKGADIYPYSTFGIE